MAEVIAGRPIEIRSKAERTETNPERTAEQLAMALLQAGYECVIALPSTNATKLQRWRLLPIGTQARS
jgi:hypothetical protein